MNFIKEVAQPVRARAEKDILYLGSGSKSRQWLLKEIKIDYRVLGHNSDECLTSEGREFEQYVLDIARDKMDHLIFPGHSMSSSKGEIFVLTADTMGTIVKTGLLLRKPNDLQDAKRILTQIAEGPVRFATGCCLEKRILKGDVWEIIEKEHWVTSAQLEFVVEADELDRYFLNLPGALVSAGAGIVEGFGAQYVKSVDGSHSTIIGLPLFELRIALKKMGFRF